jgi:hypothetical protein
VAEVKSREKFGVGYFVEKRLNLINPIPGLPGLETHDILTTSYVAEPMERDQGGMEQSNYPGRLE